MRVFVTGASGFVGSAVTQELLSHGHEVLGLARSDASAKIVAELGGKVHRGSLEDLDSLKRGAAETDGTIHCGFVHDFSRYAEVCAIDLRAIEEMAGVLAKSGKPFINTSGVAGLTPGKLATENDVAPANAFPRVPAEHYTIALAERGIRAMVVRLPPSVHDANDHGFIPMLIGIAKQKGVSAYVGEGKNRWAGGHRLDAAALYRLALEKGTPGARYHGVGDEGVATRELAEAIGRGLGLPVVSKTPEEATQHFGFMGQFFGMDMSASSALTQRALGWKPTHLGLVADIEKNYFR
jgi:nucleoside-diphosphate-sugar epimerase